MTASRCTQAVRPAVHEQAQRGLSQRAGYANFERIGAQLHHHDSRFDARDESPKGHLSRLGDSLCWPAGVRTPLPRRMACEDLRDRGTPSCGTLLRAVRHLGGLRQGVRREPLAESRKHPTTKLLRQIPSIGPIRAALILLAILTLCKKQLSNLGNNLLVFVFRESTKCFRLEVSLGSEAKQRFCQRCVIGRLSNAHLIVSAHDHIESL